MSIIVWIGIQANEAVDTAMNDQGTCIVSLVQLVAKDTASPALRFLDIGITPRRPEIIHGEQCIWMDIVRKTHRNALAEEQKYRKNQRELSSLIESFKIGYTGRSCLVAR